MEPGVRRADGPWWVLACALLLTVRAGPVPAAVPPFTLPPTSPAGGPTVAVAPFEGPQAPEHTWLGWGIAQSVTDRLSRLRAVGTKAIWETAPLAAASQELPLPADTAAAVLDLLHADFLAQGRCTVAGDKLRVAVWLFAKGGQPPAQSQFDGTLAGALDVAREIATHLARVAVPGIADDNLTAVGPPGTGSLEAFRWYTLGVQSEVAAGRPEGRQTEPSKAMAAFEQASRLDPAFAAPLHHFADLALTSDRKQEGAAAELRALPLPPLDLLQIVTAGTQFGPLWAADPVQKARAVEVYDSLPREGPFAGATAFGKGELLHAYGDVDGALAAFAAAHEFEPSWGMPYLYAAMLAQLNDRQAEALAAYRGYLALDGGWEEGWRVVGRLLLIRRDYAGAVEAYSRAADLAPSSAAAHAGLGEAFAGLSRDAEAVAAFRKAAELDPNQGADIRAKLARLYAKNLAVDERLSVRPNLQLAPDVTVGGLLEALTLATGVPLFAGVSVAPLPASVDPAGHSAAEVMQLVAAAAGAKWTAEGEVYLLRADPETRAQATELPPEVKQELAPAIAYVDEHPDALDGPLRLALELGRRGYHGLALWYLVRFDAAHPGQVLPDILGMYYEAAGQLRQAVTSYREGVAKALAAVPPRKPPYCQLAQALWQMGDFDAAIEAKRACVDAFRDESLAHTALASQLYRVGRLQEARREVRLGLETPGLSVERAGRNRELLDLIDRRSADPHAWQALLDQGRAFLRLGHPLMAAEALSAASNLNPDSQEAKDALAEARQALEATIQ